MSKYMPFSQSGRYIPGLGILKVALKKQAVSKALCKTAQMYMFKLASHKSLLQRTLRLKATAFTMSLFLPPTFAPTLRVGTRKKKEL